MTTDKSNLENKNELQNIIEAPNDSESVKLAAEMPVIAKKSNRFWTVFSSTFITIFLAEMGDKTQLVTLLMSAESQSPWIVFTGAAIALFSTSLLGVLIGYWLSKRLSAKTLDFSVAMLLLFITAWLINDII